MPFMFDDLPIKTVLPKIRDALRLGMQLILQAPSGAGKTTVVPLALLDEPWLQGKKILLLEPRRLAARNAANRMAELLGEAVGGQVGYRIRQETKVSNKTRIEVVTEGVLTRMLQSDPALEEAGVVIFDEFHERSLHADLGLALVLQTQALLRDDLKLVVMSATLNAEAIRGVMPNADVVSSEGKAYPVAFRYLDIRTKQPDAGSVAKRAAETILKALGTEEGSVLAFLPGVREIRQTERLLEPSLNEECMITPLYGDLSKAAQQRAIEPTVSGKRKIVLATNIAETSLTIEGVRIVVDSGLERTVHFDSDSGMNRMTTQRISRDSAVQRAGRAGRTQSGVCYRLWHESSALAPHIRAEILHSDLAPLLLELAKWGTAVDELTWADRPPVHAEKEAAALLISLNMIDADGRITSHGEAALSIGIHPRMAHMLLVASEKGFGYEAVLIVTLLLENTGIESVDLSEGMERLETLLRNGDGSSVLRHSVNVLIKRLGIERPNRIQPETAAPLIALAYPERIAKRRNSGSAYFVMANGKGAMLSDETRFAGSEYLSVADAGGQGDSLRIFHAAALSPERIFAWFQNRIETQERVSWNAEGNRVDAVRVRRIGAVTLTQERIETPSPEAVSLGLLEGIRLRGLALLPWDKKSLSLRARVNFINAHRNGTFASLDDATLLGTMQTWLLPYLDGMRDLKGLQQLDLNAVLSAVLGWEALQLLDTLAPESVTVPSGSKIRIDYADPLQPVLAVRLQEMFGLHETPKVLEGRVPLLIHLLSPAHRPIQVTMDLASFWKEGYAEVRKELRGKYKKHYWPENPLDAAATSKTKKFM